MRIADDKCGGSNAHHQRRLLGNIGTTFRVYYDEFEITLMTRTCSNKTCNLLEAWR